jgi:hypothetical protein
MVKTWMNEGLSALSNYDGIYLLKIIQLAQSIHNKQTTALATYGFHSINYQPVSDGEEHNHAEVLYKQCLNINEFTRIAR